MFPALTAAGAELLAFMSKPAVQGAITLASLAPVAVGSAQQFTQDPNDPGGNFAGGAGSIAGGLGTGALAAGLAPKGYRKLAFGLGSIPGIALGGNARGLFDDPVSEQIDATSRLARAQTDAEVARALAMRPLADAERSRQQAAMADQMRLQAQYDAFSRYQQALFGSALNPPQLAVNPSFAASLGQIGSAALM